MSHDSRIRAGSLRLEERVTVWRPWESVKWLVTSHSRGEVVHEIRLLDFGVIAILWG